ncbi:hypothetical protein CPB83DRAFT_860794 [Crepidotus variabilis]|uniref:Nephrocystin 3-like N-terminal domain-containing protein n=1 Tax=Crepidotus variabilis TaxID=179855 RepID=A0A9P6JKY4_9AGAR|nr:hypothetical protein CPB83DRAFT_860794 [Crepidotus variabilis]
MSYHPYYSSRYPDGNMQNSSRFRGARTSHSRISTTTDHPAISASSSSDLFPPVDDSNQTHPSDLSRKNDLRVADFISSHDLTHHTSIFAGGNNVVSGGTFKIEMGSADVGLFLLSECISKAAMHDSSARYPLPKCHPETRNDIVRFILEWIINPTSTVSVYWLHAPFGHGKSAVMQTVIDTLVETGHRDLLAGGFFFGRGKADRDKAHFLPATIAYQIATNIPGMRQHISHAITADPALPSKSLEIQLRALIIDPLLKSKTGVHFHQPPTIFIDGLDECDTIAGQLSVLDLISSCLLGFHLPVRFLVASRPESYLVDAFNKAPFDELSRQLRLDNDWSEMNTYFESEFTKISSRHSRSIETMNIGAPWPSREQICELVKRACGQYVYAETVIRFVGDYRVNPVSQLDVVLCRQSDSSVFTDMDLLYRQVLHQCPAQYRHILTALTITMLYTKTFYGSQYLITMASFSEIWRFPSSDVRLVVDSLAAVVKEDEGHCLSFHHLSFTEFLQDENRSAEFCCNNELAMKMWRSALLEAFELAISGQLVLSQSASFRAIEVVLYGYDNTIQTSSELQEFLCLGQQQVVWGSFEFEQWHRVVRCLTGAIRGFTRTLNEEDRRSWLSGQITVPFSAILYQQCLDIWKRTADRALAQMEPQLAHALLNMPAEGATAAELAQPAEMDKEVVRVQLARQRVLVYSIGDVFLLRGDFYFDIQGRTLIPLRYIRRQFYSLQ